MINHKWLITIVLIYSCILLCAQDYTYSNNSLRFGIGYASILDESNETEDLTSVVFYSGFQFRKLEGRLRIVPAIDISYANIEVDQQTDLELIGSDLTLSANYDLFKGNKSSLFIGIGGGLRFQSLLFKKCEPDIDCEFIKLGSDRGPSFNFNLGYRYEKEKSKAGYEFYGRLLNGDLGRAIQILFLIDLKLK